MSEPLAAKRTTTAVRCEKHGLHYDPSRMDGCVICRREAGGGTTAATAANTVRTGASAASGSSMGQALAVTAILLLLTTACLYFAHGVVMKSFGGAFAAEALDGGFEDPMQEMQEMSFPEEDDDGPVYSGSEGD